MLRYILMSIQKYLKTELYMRPCLYIYSHMSANAYSQTNTSKHTHTHTHRDTHTHTHKHTLSHTHTHKTKRYIDTHAHIGRPSPTHCTSCSKIGDTKTSPHTQRTRSAAPPPHRRLTLPFLSECALPQEDAAPSGRCQRARGGGGGAAHARR